MIALLLESHQWRRGEESRLAGGEELVGPGGSVTIAVAVVLMLEILTTSVSVLRNL